MTGAFTKMAVRNNLKQRRRSSSSSGGDGGGGGGGGGGGRSSASRSGTTSSSRSSNRKVPASASSAAPASGHRYRSSSSGATIDNSIANSYAGNGLSNNTVRFSSGRKRRKEVFRAAPAGIGDGNHGSGSGSASASKMPPPPPSMHQRGSGGGSAMISDRRPITMNSTSYNHHQHRIPHDQYQHQYQHIQPPPPPAGQPDYCSQHSLSQTSTYSHHGSSAASSISGAAPRPLQQQRWNQYQQRHQQYKQQQQQQQQQQQLIVMQPIRSMHSNGMPPFLSGSSTGRKGQVLQRLQHPPLLISQNPTMGYMPMADDASASHQSFASHQGQREYAPPPQPPLSQQRWNYHRLQQPNQRGSGSSTLAGRNSSSSSTALVAPKVPSMPVRLLSQGSALSTMFTPRRKNRQQQTAATATATMTSINSFSKSSTIFHPSSNASSSASVTSYYGGSSRSQGFVGVGLKHLIDACTPRRSKKGSKKRYGFVGLGSRLIGGIGESGIHNSSAEKRGTGSSASKSQQANAQGDQTPSDGNAKRHRVAGGEDAVPKHNEVKPLKAKESTFSPASASSSVTSAQAAKKDDGGLNDTKDLLTNIAKERKSIENQIKTFESKMKAREAELSIREKDLKAKTEAYESKVAEFMSSVDVARAQLREAREEEEERLRESVSKLRKQQNESSPAANSARLENNAPSDLTKSGDGPNLTVLGAGNTNRKIMEEEEPSPSSSTPTQKDLSKAPLQNLFRASQKDEETRLETTKVPGIAVLCGPNSSGKGRKKGAFGTTPPPASAKVASAKSKKAPIAITPKDAPAKSCEAKPKPETKAETKKRSAKDSGESKQVAGHRPRRKKRKNKNGSGKVPPPR